jgi:hypothetical protein
MRVFLCPSGEKIVNGKYPWQAQKAPEKMKKPLINQPPHSSPFPTFPPKSEKFFTLVRPNVFYLQTGWRACTITF